MVGSTLCRATKIPHKFCSHCRRARDSPMRGLRFAGRAIAQFDAVCLLNSLHRIERGDPVRALHRIETGDGVGWACAECAGIGEIPPASAVTVRYTEPDPGRGFAPRTANPCRITRM